MTEVVLGQGPADWPITIGVALPIPEPFLGELGAYRERFGDPLAHAIVAHITLVPPTQVADETHLAAIIDHLRSRAAGLEPFEVVLAGADSFRPVSQVVFVPLVQGAQRVCEIESVVRSGPLDRQLSFAYHPHVTIAHDLDTAWLDQAHDAMQSYRASFDVDQLVLFRQGADGVWRPSVGFAFGERTVLQRDDGEGLAIEVVTAERLPGLCAPLGEILAESVAAGAGVDLLQPFSAEDGAAWWRDQVPEVAAGRRIVLVARAGGTLVGTISVNPAPAPNHRRRAELNKLLVNATDRRRGVATRLMAAAESHARSMGYRLLMLDCATGGPVEQLYRGLGYEAVGTVPGFGVGPDGQPQDATFMYLALR
jgi:2'-5' RNA ligase/GNAT superfamily N-acetyltransferase